MCDTFVATPDSTAGGVMLFGKNSDRQRNEAQAIEIVPRAAHAAGAVVKCTYITIPQARRTHAVLLCRPCWMWGAEMGANEHGVAIGNEGLYARRAAPEQPVLTGMDLLRIALERAVSAAEAVEVITEALETYGQGGNCGHMTPAYYHNSFLIADRRAAYVLETVEREWLVKRVHGLQAISNHYTIESDPDRTSGGLSALVSRFASESAGERNYADLIADPTKAHIGSARERRARAVALLSRDSGRVSVETAFAALRDHDPAGAACGWDPARAVKYSLCIHAGALNKDCQTTGSMVSEIGDDTAVHWVTGTSSPCISIFKPVLLDTPLPAKGLRPTDRFDPDTLWWRHDRLHRRALRSDFARFLRDIGAERDALERDFKSRIDAVLRGGSALDRRHIIDACWRDAIEVEERWEGLLQENVPGEADPFRAAWSEMNRLAGLTD
jgi:dipeptidase